MITTHRYQKKKEKTERFGQMRLFIIEVVLPPPRRKERGEE